MVVEVIKNGKVVASSKNLEVITRYTRQANTFIVSMIKRNNTLYVRYSNGAGLKTNFASENILKEFIKKRGF